MPAIEYALMLVAAAASAQYHPRVVVDYYTTYMDDLAHTDAPEWDAVTWEPMSTDHTRPYWARTH